MKKTLFFVLALSAFGTSQAVQITESQALRTASEYFADRAFSSLSAVKAKQMMKLPTMRLIPTMVAL